MSRAIVLPLSVLLCLSGCTSLSNPGVRADLFETSQRGAQALQGSEPAFERLDQLQDRWACRGKQGFVYTITPWDHANRDRAASIADASGRVLEARDAILSQRDLVEVMANALRDLESEYDSVITLLEEGGGQTADITLAADQKYLARRMISNLVLMSGDDMSQAVEAADVFGRDVSRFQAMLDASINGNDDLGIAPPDNPEVEDSLAQIEELFSGYIADSAVDVLETVVARYDAWSAVQEIAGQGDRLLPRRDAAPATAQPEPEPAAGDEAGDDAAMEDAAGDDAAADEADLDAAEPADDGATGDEPVDEAADDAMEEPAADAADEGLEDEGAY